MTVPSTRFREDYAGNGSATSFPYAFRIFKATDLVVTKTDNSGNDTTLTLGTDYTVTGAGSYNGGAVVLTTALPTSYRLTIERVLAIRQDTDLRNQGEFLAETHEDAFDRLTMIVQRLAGYLGMGQGGTLRTLLLGTGDVDGAGAFRARGNRISGLGDPMLEQDAINRRYLDSVMASAVTVGMGAVVDSIATLRLMKKSGASKVFVSGYYEKGDGGGGSYYYDENDITSIDNGGNVIVASDGGRWKLAQTTAVSIKQFGAKMNGIVDDTVKAQKALDCGLAEIQIPEGILLTTGLEIKTNSVITKIRTSGFPTIKLITGHQRIALKISKGQFLDVDDLKFDSTGSKSDGHGTIGLYMESQSYMSFGSVRFSNFSWNGAKLIQCVYFGFKDVTAGNCTYGIGFEKDTNSIPCVGISIERAYISGCTRGISSDGTVSLELGDVILEYSGGPDDGALHCTSTQISCRTIYFEACNRNYIFVDTSCTFYNKYELAATLPNSVTYYAQANADRGTAELTHNFLKIRNLQPDAISGFDLTFGSNLVAPVAGGSVKWGEATTESLSGTVAAGTWTTIKTLGTDQTGGNSQKAAYIYTVYGGLADLGTGFDFGTIFNGTARSFSGTLPAWLRMSGTNLQINLNSNSYGLNWKLVLIRIYPGA